MFSSQIIKKYNYYTIALTIFIFSLILRLHNNGVSSLSLDEMISLHISKNSFLDSFYYNHPPLYFQLLKCWMNLVPPSEGSFRLLNAIISACSTLALGWLGLKIYNPKASIVMMLLHSVFPVSIVNAQQISNYSLFELISIIQFYYFLTYTKFQQNKTKLIVTTVMNLMTNYFAALLILLQLAFTQREKIKIEKLFLYLMLSLIAVSLIVDVIDVQSLAWQKAEFLFNKDGFLPTALLKSFLYLSPLSGALIIALSFKFFKDHYNQHKASLILGFVAIFLLMLVSLLMQRFIFAPRYFTFLIPGFIIFIWHIIANLGQREKYGQYYLVLTLSIIIVAAVSEYNKYVPIKISNWYYASQKIGKFNEGLIVTSLPEYIRYPYFAEIQPGITTFRKYEDLVSQINMYQGKNIWLMDTYLSFLSYQEKLNRDLALLNYKVIDFSIQEPNVDPIMLFKIEKKMQ